MTSKKTQLVSNFASRSGWLGTYRYEKSTKWLRTAGMVELPRIPSEQEQGNYRFANTSSNQMAVVRPAEGVRRNVPELSHRLRLKFAGIVDVEF